jgi:hypothetical protein
VRSLKVPASKKEKVGERLGFCRICVLRLVASSSSVLSSSWPSRRWRRMTVANANSEVRPKPRSSEERMIRLRRRRRKGRGESASLRN